jgi:hypothetical protein
MLDKTRIRAFAKFIKEHSEETLIDYLDRNEKSGIIYHYKDQLIGDYDNPKTEDEIIQMIINGK